MFAIFQVVRENNHVGAVVVPISGGLQAAKNLESYYNIMTPDSVSVTLDSIQQNVQIAEDWRKALDLMR